MRPKPQIDRGKQKKNKGDDESALAEGVLDAQRKTIASFFPSSVTTEIERD